MIFDLYSKRQKKLRGDVPDVYIYDSLPEPLRVQIVHIWRDCLGGNDEYYQGKVQGAYEFIVSTLRREYGVFSLPHHEAYRRTNCIDELTNFFLNIGDIEKAIDAIELSFQVIDRLTRGWEYLNRRNSSEIADRSIEELNRRFKEHGVGFQFVEGEIVRVDSELVHSEAVKPALALLNVAKYSGPQEEFLRAYEHYRKGNNKEALNECLKSFESTMRAICDEKGWAYPSNATAKTLINVCFDKGIVPTFWQSQLTSLRTLLESSVPTGRNKLSGHGQGASVVNIPDYLAGYMLHMTASTLVFLVKSAQSVT